MTRPEPPTEEYAGPHRDLLDSFREAEDSESLLDSYIDRGRVWVVRGDDGEVLGHLQAAPGDDGAWEVLDAGDRSRALETMVDAMSGRVHALRRGLFNVGAAATRREAIPLG